jgi:hypothetical protein
MAEIMPTKQQFSGQPSNQHGPALKLAEYLETLNRVQRRERLSREELTDFLLMTSTGPARQMILLMTQKGQSIDMIYKALSLNFDRRVHPSVAMATLGAFRAAKNQTLVQIEASIMKLAHRASEVYLFGPTRDKVYEIEACQALLRSLPSASNILATNSYQSLSARLGRAPNYSEVIQSLDRLSISIDQDIKTNGVAARTKGSQNGRVLSKKKGFPNRGKKDGGQ